MTRESSGAAHSVRAALRKDLTAAIKARDADAVAALRSAIAAIDNAESVDPTTDVTQFGSGSFAQSVEGVGSTEVARRELSAADVSALLHGNARDYVTAAEAYESLGQSHAAARLRRQADIVGRHL